MSDTSDLRSTLVQALSALDAGGASSELASLLADLATWSDREALTLAASQLRTGDAPEARLYRRALRDYAGLSEHVAGVRDALVDSERFVAMMAHKDERVDALQPYLRLIHSLDLIVQHALHLVQMDSKHPLRFDVRQGYEFASGSARYQRVTFGPSAKTNE